MKEAASNRADGTEEGICSVCGYTESRALIYAESDGSDKDGMSFIRIVLIVVAALALITVVLLVVESIQREKRRRRRRRRRRY